MTRAKPLPDTMTAEQFREMRADVKPRKRSHAPGEMNPTEARYESLLATKKMVGAIQDYGFERLKLKLPGHRMSYTPDFDVEREATPGLIRITCYDVKGDPKWKRHREDAWKTIKMAAAAFRWIEFKIALWTPEGWKYETVPKE